MAETKVDLQQYLLTQKVDLSTKKPDILENDELLGKSASAWTKEGEGIKATIENRMQKIRQELIFSATPYEVLPKREALAELATLLADFEANAQESAKRAEKREEQAEEEPEKEEEAEPVEDKSSM